jgi:dTDP-4-dehydrorhamnose reductase
VNSQQAGWDTYLKNNMRIFITGASGQLAKSITQLYPNQDLHLASRDMLDITDKKQVITQITKFKPNIVFHFASLTRGDECAKEPEKAYAINVDGTKHVVEACKKLDIPILFVSTNEVFDGKKKKSYIEMDLPNHVTVAGTTKHEAEKIIMKNLKKYYIVRTSWLYSKWSSNFIHAVLKKARSDNKIELVKDEIGTPTYSHDLAQAIKKLLLTKKYGVYHLVNKGIVSRLDFAKKVFEIKKLKVKIIPVGLNDFNRISKPPKYTPLKNVQAKKHGITLPRWDHALRRFLEDVE